MDDYRPQSQFAHLSPLLHVRVGERLELGQKIGVIGRRYTAEKGGFKAHLHFGLHAGPFGKGGWVGDSVGQEAWVADQGGWLDPQKFLKDHQ